MIIQYTTPNTVVMDGLEANQNFNPSLLIKKKVTEVHTLIEAQAYTLLLYIEHYQENDEEQTPINNGIITPYTCRVQVREDAQAYVNLATLEPFIPQSVEQLQQMADDPDNLYMNEFQAFNKLHNEDEVNLKQLKMQVILRAQQRGQLDIPYRP